MNDKEELFSREIDIVLPIKTVSELNVCEHWRKRHARFKLHRSWVNCAFPCLDGIQLPCTVVLHRIGKRVLDDDNLPGSMKAVRDSVADLLIPGMKRGQADGDKRISWEYTQSTGKEYGVRVIIGRFV